MIRYFPERQKGNYALIDIPVLLHLTILIYEPRDLCNPRRKNYGEHFLNLPYEYKDKRCRQIGKLPVLDVPRSPFLPHHSLLRRKKLRGHYLGSV